MLEKIPKVITNFKTSLCVHLLPTDQCVKKKNAANTERGIGGEDA